MNISTRLKKLVSKPPSKKLQINHFLNKFQKKDKFFLIILLALPPATPLSFIPGFSVIFGISIVLITTQILLGRSKIWLPSLLKKQKIPSDLEKGILKIIPFVKILEKYVKKRMPFFSSKMKYFFIFSIFILSILLMLPIPYVDFISSLIIICISIGIIKRDGLLLISAFTMGILYIFILFFILKIGFSLIYKLYNLLPYLL